MKVLAENRLLSMGRMLFVDKGDFTKDQLEIESTGAYKVEENEECFIIKNAECCMNIMVTVRLKEE